MKIQLNYYNRKNTSTNFELNLKQMEVIVKVELSQVKKQHERIPTNSNFNVWL